MYYLYYLCYLRDIATTQRVKILRYVHCKQRSACPTVPLSVCVSVNALVQSHSASRQRFPPHQQSANQRHSRAGLRGMRVGKMHVCLKKDRARVNSSSSCICTVASSLVSPTGVAWGGNYHPKNRPCHPSCHPSWQLCFERKVVAHLTFMRESL